MKIKVRAKVHPTEDLGKLEEAIKNIFPKLKLSQTEDYLEGESTNPEVLEHLKNQLGLQAIRDSARKALRSGREDNLIHFKINRQAATVSKVSFTEGETPLGPIEVEIQSKEPDLVTDYLTPRTREGKPVRKVTLEELKTTEEG
ncbi:hypothetical protein AKJ47_02435 [candidate division MSBL1 archaeon SCGC-AAA261G05]|uniref:UPF0201 protein AKJ47_02435 n=2 Tax=candidate division MSBL1 TaxID=215777 RepID=A0A133VA96_9EURY|nr:hypothetical protein AKJ47_02435 [candidate division MSBL1 archaeon SCGC-AAA261G05]KXB04443.1 hypothetical protein AKJ48_02550 [candidate division MSBL1 archaeon SCGC-AAA261O19]